MTTVLNIYPEPHTQSAGAPSNLRSPLPVNNNHSVRHTPWTSHSVSRCSVRPAISTTCQQQPVLNIYPEPHTPSAGAPSNLRSLPPVNNNHTTSARLRLCLYKVNSVDNIPSMGERYTLVEWRMPPVQRPVWICPHFRAGRPVKLHLHWTKANAKAIYLSLPLLNINSKLNFHSQRDITFAFASVQCKCILNGRLTYLFAEGAALQHRTVLPVVQVEPLLRVLFVLIVTENTRAEI